MVEDHICFSDYVQLFGGLRQNMIRAGVVDHPEKWKESGYYEIQHPKNRYAIIDCASSLKILKLQSMDRLQEVQQVWIKDALEKNRQRDGK